MHAKAIDREAPIGWRGLTRLVLVLEVCGPDGSMNTGPSARVRVRNARWI